MARQCHRVLLSPTNHRIVIIKFFDFWVSISDLLAEKIIMFVFNGQTFCVTCHTATTSLGVMLKTLPPPLSHGPHFALVRTLQPAAGDTGSVWGTTVMSSEEKCEQERWNKGVSVVVLPGLGEERGWGGAAGLCSLTKPPVFYGLYCVPFSWLKPYRTDGTRHKLRYSFIPLICVSLKSVWVRHKHTEP